MLVRTVLVLFLLLGEAAVAEVGSPAAQVGPRGYPVIDVHYVPGSAGPGMPGTAFVAVGSELFRTINGGQTLEVTGLPSADPIQDVAIAADGTLYVASGNRILISTDGGASFAATVPTSAGQVILEQVEVHPTNAQDIWVGYRQGFSSGGILRSTDGGQSWSLAPPAGWSGKCAAIAFDPQAPDRMLLVRHSYYAYLSTDGGATWTQTAYTNAGDTALDATFVDSHIVLSTSSRLVVTTDDGATWSTIPGVASIPQAFSLPGATRIMADPSTVGRAVLATRVGGLFESTDSGLSWSPLTGPTISADEFVLNSGDVSMIGTPYGLLHRTASGAYGRAELPASAVGRMAPLDVADLSIDPGQSNRMAALVRPTPTSTSYLSSSALMTTANSGASWTFDSACPPRPISVDHGPNGDLYVTGSQTLVNGDASECLQRWTPAGWTPIGPTAVPGDTVWCWDVEVSPTDPLELFALTASQINAFEQQLLFLRSLDGGVSWQTSDSLTSELVQSFPEITIFGTSPGGAPRIAYIQRLPSSAFYGGEALRVSDDGGSTWAVRSGASYFDNETMHVSGGGANPGRLYAARMSPQDLQPLQVSDDGGLTWRAEGTPLTRIETVTASTDESNTLYRASYGGVVRGTYSGASVETLGSITGSVSGTRVASAPGGTIVAAFGSSGVWLKTVPAASGTSYCGPAVPNSTGASAELRMEGTPSLSANALTLVARRLPAGSTSLAIVGDAETFTAQPGGSFGNLCLGGAIGRFTPDAGSSGPDGTYQLVLDLGRLPRPGGTASAFPGQTLYFQTWFRDAVGGTVASNFTDAVSVLFTN
ncbi:Ycf48-like protein [Planctomycetes bacterium Poly30]|uniref:Ycf48-like protein n=1 Tax=Saltatorellus ferox TaxID=2528018 RepID=A0A518F156_9BACT|nr:Ycf48-like protein [Planctomycetes bacterium Poly30]